MKKIIKVYLSLLILLSIYTTTNVNAITNLTPKYKIKLPAKAFNAQLAVHDKTLYYFLDTAQRWGSYEIYSRSINSAKSKKIYTNEFGGARGEFKVLSDGNIYLVTHQGGALMGFDLVFSMDGKSKLPSIAEHTKAVFSGYGTMDLYEDGTKTYQFSHWGGPPEEDKEYDYVLDNNIVTYLNDESNILSFAPKYSFVRNGKVYLKKILLKKENNDNLEKGNFLVERDLKTGQEKILIENIDSMTIGKDHIYYWEFISKKDKKTKNHKLYSYSLKNAKKEFICEAVNPYPHLLLIDDNIYFSGTKSKKDTKNRYNRIYNTVFTIKDKKSLPLFTDAKKVMSDGYNIAVLFENGKNSTVKLLDSKGKEYANLTVPVTEADLFISKRDLIVWSWQDRTVRYYDISRK